MSKIVSLPELPTNRHFEDYVAAYIQAAGFYIDKSIIDKNIVELLELDIIFTDYQINHPPLEKLIEVKSGNWGFSDVFKMLGWGTYLEISDLNLVVSKINGDHQSLSELSIDNIGVNIIHHPNNENDISESKLLNIIPNNNNIDIFNIDTWRYIYRLEETIIKKLKNKRKTNKNIKSYEKIYDYYVKLHHDTFFIKKVVKRIRKLYQLYENTPRLTSMLSHELLDKEFNHECKDIPQILFKETFYQYEFNDLAISTYVEHRSKLAIIKAAIDLSLFEKFGCDDRTEYSFSFGGRKMSMKNTLKSSFLDGIDSIKNDPYMHRYPIFWQVFLWQFGGFILEDYKEDDYKLLSLATGIPVNEIDNALSVYDKLFPLKNKSWFIQGSQHSNIRVLQFVCIPFLGMGVHTRLFRYTNDRSIKSLKLTGTYTESNLDKWVNTTTDILLISQDVLKDKPKNKH